MPEETRKGFDFDRALAVWRRRKWLAILIFAAPFSVTVSLTAFVPKLYRSTATLVVERQQVPKAFVRPTVASPGDTDLQIMRRQILGWSGLQDLIIRFDLYPDLRKRGLLEAAIARMGRDIEVGRPGRRGSTALMISYQGRDPQRAALVTNMLAGYYVDQSKKGRERQATGTAQFLKMLLERKKQQLEEQERRLSDFKKRYMGELPQQMQANLSTLERLTTGLRLNSRNQREALDRREALARQLARAETRESAGRPDLIGPVRAPTAAAEAQLARLRYELTQLRSRFSDKYPDVVQLKAEIAALERQRVGTKPDVKAKEASSALPHPYVLELRQALEKVAAELKVLKAEERRLRADIATYQRRVENAPRREQEFQELSRDYGTTKNLYYSLLTRYEEAQLAESLERRQKGEQFRIVEPASPAAAPSSPKSRRLILVGLMLSVGLAAGVVMLAEQLDTSFHTVDDLRAFTGVPVLVSIPRIVTKADARRRRWRVRLAVMSAMLGLTLIVGATYLLAAGNEQLVWTLARFRF